jgi:FtsH-binding integral membrane protein
MATAAVQATPISTLKRLPGRRFDNLFFSISAVLMLLTVFIGFARTYFLAGVFRAHLPSPIIHVHGAAFSCWIILLVVQTSLVSAHRVDLHRKLGVAGFILACCMVVLGVLAATNSLVRNSAPAGLDPRTFYMVPVTDILMFATLVAFAFRARRDSASHKRIILLATSGLMIAAFARWPVALLQGKILAATLATYIFLAALVVYDLWSTHRIHRATLWAGAFLVIVQNIRIPIAMTHAWLALAGWIQWAAK